MTILISLLLAGLALLSVNLLKVYGALPVKQLAKRARAGDTAALWLHQVIAYGISLRMLLWLLIGLSFSGFFVYSAQQLPGWLVLITGSGLVAFCFSWLHNHQVSRPGEWLARQLARPLAALLNYLHAPLNWLARQIHRLHPVQVHTGVYDKEDLVNLITSQRQQADNQIADYELELALNALAFGDRLVRDSMTPRRMVKTVAADDSIGPLLMDELHASGFSRFPVYEGEPDNIIGTLFLRDLVNVKSTAVVREVMRPEVCYIHEDQTLYDALQAILKTRHHLLIVINSFEEFVGALSIEDVLEKIIGRSIVDEFDQYDDLRAVAARAARTEHQSHQ